MKLLAMFTAMVGTIAFLNAPAMASDNYYNGGGHAAVHHAQDHGRLNHRAHGRAIQHHNAHDYGISPRQDARLHYRLNRQAARDDVGHHVAHDAGVYLSRGSYAPFGYQVRGYQQYGYPQQSVRIQTPGYGFWFGN